jgi:glycosyltransferase involved in cell wall biosynthesis
VGDGPERAILATAQEGIVWLGNRRDVPDLLAASDVVCLTSEVEALPMALLEGAMAGRALLAPRIGEVPDIVVDGETGFLFDVGDIAALTRYVTALAEAPGLAAQLGQRARALAQKNYGLDPMADAYAEAFTSLTVTTSR